MDKKILDVTCGAKSIWFDKHHPAAVYCDKRHEQYHHLWKNAGNCTLDINPDVVCDFTDLPFQDNSFPLVVFDPPHLTRAKETAWLVKKYGKLDANWPRMIHDGFRECMRVLKPDGVLIFKWSEYDIPAADVWKAIGQKPLFGHHSGKQSRTFWACFMKFDERTPPPAGGRGERTMNIPQEFEDVFRGVELTEDEIRTLTWIAGWESRTVENLCSAIRKVRL